MSISHQTIIFLHGFTGTNAGWFDIGAHFAPDYTIFTPDITGHGSADAPGDSRAYHMDKIAEKILAITDSNFHLVGYSMGGRIALYIATRFADRLLSLTLESASPGLKTAEEREARQNSDTDLARKIEHNGMEWFVNYWENLSLWDSQSAELKAILRQRRLQNNPSGLANSLRGTGTGAMPSLWKKLPGLTIPVQLIAGELDSKFVAINQDMATLIPDSKLTIIPGAGHAVHLEKPHEFKKCLRNFLESL